MVTNLIWLPTARKHLKQIYKFLAMKNERAAIKNHNRLLDATLPLASFPLMGTAEPLLENKEKTYRFLVSGKYKIIYYHEKETVYIAAVWDCRRNTSRLGRLFK